MKIKSSGELQRKLEEFDSSQLREIFRNVGAIQLTKGCSIGCNWCGIGATKPIRDYIEFSFLEKVVKEFSREIGEARPFLYYASDPFDYEFDDHNYLDVDNLFRSIDCNYFPYISTAVPKGKEDLVVDLLLKIDQEKRKAKIEGSVEKIRKVRKEIREGEVLDSLSFRYLDFCKTIIGWADYWYTSRINRVSVSEMNFYRLRKVFEKRLPELERQSFFEDGEKVSSLIYRKRSSYKNLIDYYPNVAFPRYKDFESNNGTYVAEIFGKRIILSPNEEVNFLDVIECLQDNNQFLKNVKGYRMNITGFYEGTDKKRVIRPLLLGPKDIDNLYEYGIGCFDGVVITPKGIFNSETIKPSREFPYGLKEKPISSDNFKLVKLNVHGR